MLVFVNWDFQRASATLMSTAKRRVVLKLNFFSQPLTALTTRQRRGTDAPALVVPDIIFFYRRKCEKAVFSKITFKIKQSRLYRFMFTPEFQLAYMTKRQISSYCPLGV